MYFDLKVRKRIKNTRARRPTGIKVARNPESDGEVPVLEPGPEAALAKT